MTWKQSNGTGQLFLPCTSFQQWGSFASEWKLASPLPPGAGQGSGAHLKSSLIY